MSETLNVVLAQINLCVGDISGNTQKISENCERAESELAADVVVFPELAITGYPPEDLLLRPYLYEQVKNALSKIARATSRLYVILGYPEMDGEKIYNSCAVLYGGKINSLYRKRELPNYSVFDEKRYFKSGDKPCVTNITGFKLGLSICEDIWNPITAQDLAREGADVICNINASPFHSDKINDRKAALKTAAISSNLPIMYLNTIGGQDELVFDGGSFVIDNTGTIVGQEESHVETLFLVELKKEQNEILFTAKINDLPSSEESIYKSLVLGLEDYVNKNGFAGCIIGLSGGIDSALSLAIAVDALGSERVRAISMPSKFTAEMSINDAEEEATLLDCDFSVISIEDIVKSFETTLTLAEPNKTQGITGENIQARSRGVLLMAESNSSGFMVITTSNKSEAAVGYSTLYGDMVGGFAPLKDLNKTLVYSLAKWRNSRSYVIPTNVIERAPSAELAPNQKDSDSLPPYEILDEILELYIEKDLTPTEISQRGFEKQIVERIARLVDKSEYKRRQSAPGVRITKRAFGRDRRFPITSKYSEL